MNRYFPLPKDNWYTIAEADESHPAWGSCPPALFALVDDGGRDGARWITVNTDETQIDGE